MPSLGSEARNLTIYIKQGSDWVAEFSIQDENGVTIPLSGSSFTGRIKKTVLSEDIVASFVFNINTSTNIVTVSLTNLQTSDIPTGEKETDPASKYVYSWNWTNSDGFIDRIQEGTVIVSGE